MSPALSDPFTARWRPAPFLPEAGRPGRGSLVFVVATLCLLACLTAITVPGRRAARPGGWTNAS